MKKMLFLLLACIPFFAYAENVKNESNVTEISKSNDYAIIATFDVELNSITYPYVINIPAPSETVIGVSGPTFPNINTWKVENGRLIITLHEKDFRTLDVSPVAYIEVATNPMMHYAIQLNIN